MFKRWGIRDRMLLMALVPPTLIALILGFYVINLRIQELAQIHQDKGEALTRQMVPVARDALASGNRSLLADQVAVMLGTPSVVDVVITDRRGEIVLRRSRPPQDDLAGASRFSRWLRVRERDETLFTRAIPRTGSEDEVLGEVTIRLSRTLTRMRQMEVLFNGTLIIGVGLLISYFLALSTSRDIVVPILRLTRAVRSFRRGQLTRRVPEVSGASWGRWNAASTPWPMPCWRFGRTCKARSTNRTPNCAPRWKNWRSRTWNWISRANAPRKPAASNPDFWPT